MIRLKGPALSETAAGGLADVLTFAKSKKGTSAKTWSKPSQPRTGPQVGVRVMIKFLSKWWSTCSPTEQATWSAIADARNLAPYHAYIRGNMLRWRNFLSPSKAYPPAQILLPTIASKPQAIAGVASVNVGVRHTVGTNNVGALIFRGPAEDFPLTIDRVVQVAPHSWPLTWAWWLDTPLQPGTYWYACRMFTLDGNLGPPDDYRSATVE